MLKFLQSPNGLGWRESKGSLPVFLGRVLENCFIDHIRREKKIVRPDTSEDESTQPTANQPTLTDDLVLKEFQDRLLALVRGRKDEQELADFILAGSLTTSDGKVNQQMADLLGKDEKEVVSRRNRVLRIVGSKELREEFRDGRERNKSSNNSDRPIAG